MKILDYKNLIILFLGGGILLFSLTRQQDVPEITNNSLVNAEHKNPLLRGKIDINRATYFELQAIPGIGPSLAKLIEEDRTKRGFYRSVYDLKRIKGIGPKKLAKIEPLVEVP